MVTRDLRLKVAIDQQDIVLCRVAERCQTDRRISCRKAFAANNADDPSRPERRRGGRHVAEFFGQPDDVLRQLLDLGAGVALDTCQWHEAGECQLQLAPRPVTVGDVACRPQALQPAVRLVTCRHPGKQPRRVTRGREKELRRLPKFSSRFE